MLLGSNRFKIFWLWTAGLVWAGCTALTPAEAPTRSTPLQVQWDVEAIREHLQIFNSQEVGGRTTGTQGYARAAAYVAERLGEFGVQPAFDNDFRTLYYVSIHQPLASPLMAVGADTTALVLGFDFIAGGYSDSGRVALQRVFADFGSETGMAAAALGPHDAVLAPAWKVDRTYLESVRQAGARAALIIGPLVPRQRAQPIPGLVTLQLTPTAAALALGQQDEALLDTLTSGWRTLSRRLEGRVAIDPNKVSGAINVLGYIPGRHPKLAQELVIICADLDDIGQVTGGRTIDFEHFGLGAAALLEVARVLGTIAPYSQVPERTVLFAVWSGARLGHAGLQEYLRAPLWPLAQTHRLIYVGLSAAETQAVRGLPRLGGVPVMPVERPDTLRAQAPSILIPSPLLRRRAGRRAGRSSLELDVAQFLDRAMVEALALAQQAYDRLLAATITPAPFAPVTADTLALPSDTSLR